MQVSKKRKETIYTMVLPESEFSVLYKFIGKTTRNGRKKLGLSADENNTISKLYCDLDTANVGKDS